MIFKNLLFTPIDLDISSIPVSEINFSRANLTQSPFWKVDQLLDNPHPYTGINKWRTDLDFPRTIIKDFVMQLPFIELYSVRINVQTTIVEPHFDVNVKYTPLKYYTEYDKSEPCGYRFVLSGSSTALKIHDKGIISTAETPSVPGAYLINSTTGLHSVHSDVGRMSLYIRGKINEQLHVKFIERSLEKYSNYAIWKM
jgi:hypothetical protein